MCRFIAAIIAASLLLFSSITCLYGLISMQWYTGTGISIGIPSGCKNIVTGNGMFAGTPEFSTSKVCSGMKWEDLNGSAEQAMAVLLIIACMFGVIAVVLLVSTLCACCRLRLGARPWAPVVAGLGAGLQSITIAIVCLIMSGHYGWRKPAGTTMGPAYVLAISASVCAMVGAVLAHLHQIIMRTVSDSHGQEKRVGAV